jgi:tetratricopeptide (TPR) repeat protein
MNPGVLRRFIKIAGIATFLMFSLWAVVQMFFNEQPGDYDTRQGDIRLSEGAYEEGLKSFNRALQKRPNHRGALMGRALVFIQTERYKEAAAEFTYLIGYLEKSLDLEDPTGQAALAAAYANRGIVHDRTGKYEKALADYIKALEIDSGAVSGPGLIDKVVYGTSKPSTVYDRAVYLKKQLALPESERLLRAPHIDKKQRMYKP